MTDIIITILLNIGLPFLFISIVVVLIYTTQDKIRNSTKEKYFRYVIALASVVPIVTLKFNAIFVLHRSWERCLPFHLCNVAQLVIVYYFLTLDKKFHKTTLYWSIIGAVMAFATPDIPYEGFFYYIMFYFGHALLIIAVAYFMIIHNSVPNKSDTIKSFIYLNIFGIVMIAFNTYFKTYYLYIGPDAYQSELIIYEYMPAYPFYLIYFEVAVLIGIFVFYQIIRFLCTKFNVLDIEVNKTIEDSNDSKIKI